MVTHTFTNDKTQANPIIGCYVYVRESSSAAWVFNPNLHCESITFHLGGVSTAVLTWRYGEVIRPTDAVVTEISALTIDEWYVKIEPNILTGAIFNGVIINEQEEVFGRVTALDPKHHGRQKFLAYSHEYHLMRAVPRTTFWHQRDSETLDTGVTEEIEGMVAFNHNGNPNRSYFKSGGSYIFVNQSQKERKYWSSRDIVEYLISKHSPRSHDGTEEIEWSIATDQLDKIPNYDAPEVKREGRSVWDLLTSLVNKYRMMDVRIDFDETGIKPTVAIEVVTHVENDLVLSNGFTLKGNTETLDLEFEDYSGVRLFKTKNRIHKVDQVVGVGDNIVYVRSFEPGDFFAGWDNTLEQEYEAANDVAYPTEVGEQIKYAKEFRASDKFAAVFSKFDISLLLETTWQGTPRRHLSTQVLQKTFIENGINYSIAGSKPLHGTSGFFLSPFAVIEKPGATGKYSHLAMMGSSADVGDANYDASNNWSCRVETSRNSPHSFIMTTNNAPQHVLGGKTDPGDTGHGYFDPVLPRDQEEVDKLGSWNWRTMIITAAIQVDERLTVVKPDTIATNRNLDVPLEQVRVLEIDFGQAYRQIRMIDATVTDIASDGRLLRSLGNIKIRDDEDKMLEKVEMAWEYYRKDRNAVEVSTVLDDTLAEKIGIDFKPGVFVKTIDSGVVESVISMIRIDFPIIESSQPITEVPPSIVTFETDFGELDVTKL